MKKIVAMISVLLLGAVLYANPVTPEKALQVASRVFASGPSTKAADTSSLQIVWDGEFEPATKAAQDPAFYVVSHPEGGFVMVAGNDNVQPVLAFSFKNRFIVEGMPEHVRAWMEQYKGYVRSATTTTVEIQAQWSMFEETKAEADPITSGVTNAFTGSETNEWNQTNPANFYCPDVAGQTETSVCGCVALATAEVMAWFGSSNKQLSSHTIPEYSYNSDYEENNVTVPAHGLTTSYTADTWTQLKVLTSVGSFYGTVNGYSTAAPEIKNDYLYYGAVKYNPSLSQPNTLTALGQSLAHLTYDIGTLIGAHYNEANDTKHHYGTGAPAALIVTKVAPVFKYNNAARYVSKANYTKSQWQQLLKDEITLRPVIYTGSGSPGGHAYVADGYATYNGGLVFHFNMGWGGAYNGYYTLDIQNDFTSDHDAILDFYPSDSYTALPYIEFDKDGGGIQYDDGYYTKTLSFTLNEFYNMGEVVFSGDIYAGRENSSGTLVETKSLFTNENWTYLEGRSSSSFSKTFTDAVFGDRLVAYYKEGSKSTYIPFRYESPVGMTSIPFFPAAAIKTKASYEVGDIFVFELTNHNYDYSTSAWTVTTPGGVTKNYTMASDAVLLSEAGDYKITCTTDQETITTYITVTTP